MRSISFCLAGLSLLLCAATEPSATPTPAPKSKAPSAYDPGEIICQKQEVLGSRLAKRRVCKTRAEWADGLLQDRQEIEKVQVQRGLQN